MTEQEFKIQIFRTPGQWGSGLSYRLEDIKDGGVTLSPMVTFVEWAGEVNGGKKPSGLAVGECGLIYFMDAADCRLYQYDPRAQRLEKISAATAGGCDSGGGGPLSPSRIIIDEFTLWVLDAANHRVKAFSREHYQIKYIIDDIEAPVDIGLDREGNLYVLDQKSGQVFKYGNNGAFIKSFGDTQLKEPVALAIGKEDYIYIVDNGYTGFLKFTAEGEYSGLTGEFPAGLQPSTIVIDRQGNIFVGDASSGVIFQFDADGSYTGKIHIPGLTGPVYGLAVNSKGDLYAGTEKGIALLRARQGFTLEEGYYYTKTLDSGISNCRWHRLALKSNLPPKTVLDIYFYASDDPSLKQTIDEALTDPDRSVQEKADFIDNNIPWIGPEKNPGDMLFRGKTGRYFWLKISMSTYDEAARPSVTEMKVYYPRISYLRYLPAIYQEDPVSREFLERFLSIFESVFFDLETEIINLFRYLDPEIAPRRFLEWLASWLNLALEEDWPEERKRQFIVEASALYKLKGTPEGIKRLIELYTGKRPLILEHSREGKPVVLGGAFRLGVSSILVRTPVRGFRLGDDSIIGRVALRDSVQSPEDPFLPLVHRFTVFLNLSAEEFNLYEQGLRRILDDEKPAHTEYRLINHGEMRIGSDYIGINTRIGDYLPLHLGDRTAIGSGIVLMGGEQCGKVERHSVLNRDLKLI